MATLTLADITSLGQLRVTQVLGPGGTGSLTSTGNGCFWVKPSGKIALFQVGQFAPEYFPSGYPIIEWEIDPAVTPSHDMASAPRMTYIRTIGDFYNGHIIAASGGMTNWITGGFAPPEDIGGGILRFRWTYSDGYTGGTGYPQYGMTDLNYGAGTFTSYGPWKINVIGHRHISAQIIKLPTAFRDTYCPGYSYAAIGQQGSGNGGSPWGSSLIAIEDFNPTTKPPAANATDPYSVNSIYLIHHPIDHKMSRPTNYAICRWGGVTPTDKYDCRLNLTVTPGLNLFGGTPNGGSDGTEENDTQVGVQWIDLPDTQGLMFFYKMTATPTGYTAPGPDGKIHAGYADFQHGSASGSGYPNQGCCHAVVGVGQFDPDWRSTGPFSNFHMPVVSIYPITELVAVRGGSKQVYQCVPTTELQDWRQVDTLFGVTPPTHAGDYTGVIFFSATSWLDTRDRRLYMMSGYDFTTDSAGNRLPHISVYQIGSGGTPTPPSTSGGTSISVTFTRTI